ncbi:MAG: hypothetical protein KAT11_07520 [Phycisphaerae bacterium]|nr:hypothetical protein [Phycisphaerae bacterium]
MKRQAGLVCSVISAGGDWGLPNKHGTQADVPMIPSPAQKKGCEKQTLSHTQEKRRKGKSFLFLISQLSENQFTWSWRGCQAFFLFFLAFIQGEVGLDLRKIRAWL